MCVGWGMEKSSIKTSTKPKLKARRMYINPSDMIEPYAYLTSYRDPSADRGNTLPVAVIPLDDADRMIAKARAAYMHNGSEFTHENMRAALVAIGVLPKQRKGRK